jgi:hypothetical protein
MPNGEVLLESSDRVRVEVDGIRPDVRSDVTMAWPIPIVEELLCNPIIFVNAR